MAGASLITDASDSTGVSDKTVTVENVLDIEYPGPPEWSADGRYVASTIYEDDGQTLLFASAEGDGQWRFRPDDGFVAAFAWPPADDQHSAAVTTDTGELLLVDPESKDSRTLLCDPDGVAGITWSNAGDKLACYRDGKPTVVDTEDGSTRAFDVPVRGPYLGDARSFAWREDDERLAYRLADGNAKDVGVIDVESGDLRWRTDGPFSNQNPAWLDDGRVLYGQRGETGTVRRFVVADPETGETDVLFEERDSDRGVISRGTPQISPDGTQVAAALSLDGWDHVHVFDGETGERRQLTDGEFEDKGVASSSPQWADDSTLVFASNRRNSGQRQLFAVDVDEGETWPVVESAGNNVHPAPSPDGDRIAYVHADRNRAPELRTGNLPAPGESTDDSRRVTRSRTSDWPVEPVAPEPVSTESVDGLTVHGYLIDPRESDAVDEEGPFPGVVYVHGGPIRQMRDGWHPGRSYGLAYAVMQYFAARGYAGLLVNYRGGIGYGADFQQALAGSRGREEMDDIAQLTAQFGEREFVDGDRTGVWGLSYGGYATLQMLGTHPDTFAVGVNLAGLADLELYRDWALGTKFPEVASASPVRMGGYPSEAREAWDEASPVTHFEHYEAPLYSFHGTDDDYVNVAQQDLVVDRLLDLDAEFEAEYYPDENHVFARRAVWERTLVKIEGAFGEHLG